MFGNSGETKAELLIISAETVSHGREIAYEVKLETGDTPADELLSGSLFVDGSFGPLTKGQRKFWCDVEGPECIR